MLRQVQQKDNGTWSQKGLWGVNSWNEGSYLGDILADLGLGTERQLGIWKKGKNLPFGSKK